MRDVQCAMQSAAGSRAQKLLAEAIQGRPCLFRNEIWLAIFFKNSPTRIE